METRLSPDERHRYWAVIGRIPFDDEDTCHVYGDPDGDGLTRDEAVNAFRAQMLEDRGEEYDPDDPNANEAPDGETRVYVNTVLWSDAPIDGDYS